MAIEYGQPDEIPFYDPPARLDHERGLVEEKGEGDSPLQTDPKWYVSNLPSVRFLAVEPT